jgi:hypothetical protein
VLRTAATRRRDDVQDQRALILLEMRRQPRASFPGQTGCQGTVAAKCQITFRPFGSLRLLVLGELARLASAPVVEPPGCA